MALILDTHMPLQEWANAHEPAGTRDRDYWDQIVFVRDRVPDPLAKTTDEYMRIRARTKVISEHISKSKCLPVFRVELVDGTQFTMRYNFHDWKVSVSSPREVEADFMCLFNPSEQINESNCEGFPPDLVFGPYARNKCQFTFELYPRNYHLFTFFWIFGHQVLGNRNKDGLGT